MKEKSDNPPEFPELYQCWMRIRNKMNVMENMPRTFGIDRPLYLSEIHTLQAIGSTKDNNIRTIAEILGVTPSAASQTITRLKKKGLVKKVRGIKNEKEVSLVLTLTGKTAYACHEKTHKQMYERIAARIGDMNVDERAFLVRVFSAFESVYDERIRELSSSKNLQEFSA